MTPFTERVDSLAKRRFCISELLVDNPIEVQGDPKSQPKFTGRVHRNICKIFLEPCADASLNTSTANLSPGPVGACLANANAYGDWSAGSSGCHYCWKASFLIIFIARENFIDKDNRTLIVVHGVPKRMCNERGRLPLTLYFISFV
jgi:hypothetical protein